MVQRTDRLLALLSYQRGMMAVCDSFCAF